MKLIYIAIAFVSMIALSVPLRAFADRTITYRVGEYTYDVPTKNVLSEGVLGTLKSMAGLDKEVNSFLFKTDSSVLGGIYATTPNERVSYRSTDRFAPFWYARSRFSDREVVFHEDSGFYLGFDSVGYRGMFTVYRLYPDKNKAMPESRESVYVADCNGSSVSELKDVTCNRQVILNDILVQYSIPFQDLPKILEVELDVINSILEWRRKE